MSFQGKTCRVWGEAALRAVEALQVSKLPRLPTLIMNRGLGRHSHLRMCSMGQYNAVGSVRLQHCVPILLILLLSVHAQGTPDLLTKNINAADWTITNQNGSISFDAGQLPVMVLEGLVDAGQLEHGDPIAG